MIFQAILALALTVQAPDTPHFNNPVRITTHPAEDYMSAVSPDATSLVFISNRSGAPNIWIKSISGATAPTPRRLTFSTSGDKSPAFSPDGKYIVYVSSSSDAEGDIYKLKIPDISSILRINTSPERLTDISTADKEPVYTPDGKFIIYTSADKKGSRENLWKLDLKTLERTQLTIDGGTSADISPDGKWMVYVSRSRESRGSLHLLDLINEKRIDFIDGEYMDSFPVFIDNSKVAFVRYSIDTNGDGAISVEDRPALYYMDITNPDALAVPITGMEQYTLFPSSGGNFVYYTVKDGAQVDIYRLPAIGMTPTLGDINSDIKRAGEIENFYTERPTLAQLAWEVAYTANSGSNDKAALAQALSKRSAIMKKSGLLAQSDKILAQLIDKYPSQREQVGYALIDRAIIESERKKSDPLLLVEKLEKIGEDYKDIEGIYATSIIEKGRAYNRARMPDKALKNFRSVVAEYPDLREIAARATFLRNEVYEKLGDGERQTRVYLDVIRDYPDQEEWRDKAVGKILDLAVVEGDTRASAIQLNNISESYRDLPFLQAAAINRTGQLYYDDSELTRARETYQRILTRFPDQEKWKNEARFNIAAIYAEQENYAEALDIYKSIEQDSGAKREVYKRSRNEFINQSLEKAKYELKEGEPRIAIKTYRNLIKYDYGITDAHRGLIQSYVALGETDKVLGEYEAALKEFPDEPVYLYSLGLALTYLNPPDLDRSSDLIREAISKDNLDPWFHQTLGWIYEQEEYLLGEGDFADLALQEYQFALAFMPEDGGIKRRADLNLNIGNINFLLKNCADTIKNYKAREQSGVDFLSRQAESIFYQRFGECEFKQGEDAKAIRNFKKSFKLADESEIGRKIELLDRIGLAYQSSGRWENAVESFTQSLELRRSAGVDTDTAIVLRNIANNLYFMSNSTSKRDPERLVKALDNYRASEIALSEQKVKPKKKKSSSLFSVEVETGLGGLKGASKGFSEKEEKKLIFHHIGKIYGELSDYAKAVEYFERKLELTPKELPLLENVPVLTEKAIVINQVGYYLALLGRPKDAVARFDESLGLSLKLENRTGILTNADNMARIALDHQDTFPPELLDQVIQRGTVAVKKTADNETNPGADIAPLANHLAQLYHYRFNKRRDGQSTGDLQAYARRLRSIGADAYQAERLYKLAKEKYMLADTPEATRIHTIATMNLAHLKADTGQSETAMGLLKSAETIAGRLNMPDVLLQSRFWIYSLDPTGHADYLAKSAQGLDTLPFGYGALDNTRQVFAIVRSVFNDLAEEAYNKGDAASALAYLENGMNIGVKLALAELAHGDDDNAVPGLAGLAQIYKRKMAATDLDADKLAAAEKEHAQYIENVRSDNPLLGHIASPLKLDQASVASRLRNDEAVVTAWRRAGGTVLFAISPSGFTSFEAAPGEDITEKLGSADGMSDIRRLFLATGRPFSDPLVSTLGSGYLVSTVPSFGYLPFFKDRRSINDFNLFAIGFGDERFVSNKELFAEELYKTDIEANDAIRNGQLETAGVVMFARPFTANRVSPLGSRFPLASDAQTPIWIDIKRLIDHGANASVLSTPVFNTKNGRDWEGAALTATLLAGYPSWVIAPDSKEQYKKFSSAFLEALSQGSAGDAFDIAKKRTNAQKARMAGSFGFTRKEKRDYARKHFADKIRAGVEALRADDLQSASNNLKQALAYTRTAGVSKYDALILDRLAEVEFQLGRYDSSLAYQQRLNGLHRKSGDKEKLADSLLLTGVLNARLNDYNASVESLSSALALYRELGLTSKMANALSKLGIAEEGGTRYPQAINAFTEALNIRRQSGENQAAAMELARLGRIYHLRLNQFGKARDLYEEAIALLQNDKDRRQLVKTLIELGAVEGDAGNLDAANGRFREALAMAEAARDKKAVALAKFHLANVHWFRGEYDPAFTRIRASLKDSESLNDDRQSAISFNTMGLIYWTLNDYPRSLEYLERSLDLTRKTGARLDEASALNNIGLVHRAKGELSRSIDYFLKAREIDEELKSDWGVAYDARNISISYLLSGKLEKAEKSAKEAVALTEKIGDKVNNAKSLLQLAEVMGAKSGWKKGSKQYRQAFDAASAIGDSETMWRSLRGLGKAQNVAGERAGAIASYEQAVDIVEAMRASLKIEELKSGFLDNKQDLYEELTILELDNGNIEAAFGYAERARARSFIDLLGTTKIRLKDKISQRTFDEINGLRRNIEELAKSTADTAEDRQALTKRKEEASNALVNAIEKVRIENPGLLPFISVEPVKSGDIMKLLNDDIAILEYIVAREELIAFVITKDKLSATRVKIDRGKLTAMTSRFRKLIQDGAPMTEEARALGKVLLDPVMDKIGAAEIVGIVPHRDLHYVSFAALRNTKDYLIDEKSLFYLPTASLFQYSIKRRIDMPKLEMKTLAVGNPDLGDLDTDLPLAELEAKSIRWSFPFVDLLVRDGATETKVIGDIDQYHILHIASHGEFDTSNPLLSALRFAKDDNNNGALTAKEVFALNLNADIVVMSACQTGLGKVTSGDEVLGLNRAFLYSGAHSLVSTLWRVDDLGSAVLMKHFYRGFRNSNKAEALRKAQLIVKRRFAHPSYWAGFTLVGDYL